MKALLLAAAVLVCSPALAKIYTTTPIPKTPEQIQAENEAEYRRLLQWYQMAPAPKPALEDRLREIIRQELEKQNR